MGSEVIHDEILDRYINMVKRWDPECDPDRPTGEWHLHWMLNEIRARQFDNDYDGLKYHRWLGYIQGVLITKGYTTVNEERDFTRPYFTKVK